MPCHQVLVVLVLERTCLLVVVKNGMRESEWCELLTKSTLLMLRLVVAGPVHIAGRIFSSSAPCVGGILDEGELNCPSHTEPKVNRGDPKKGTSSVVLPEALKRWELRRHLLTDPSPWRGAHKQICRLHDMFCPSLSTRWASRLFMFVTPVIMVAGPDTS